MRKLIIEGIDRSGKDTLKNYIDIKHNFKHHVLVRSILSNLIHSKRYERERDYYNFNYYRDCIKHLENLAEIGYEFILLDITATAMCSSGFETQNFK